MSSSSHQIARRPHHFRRRRNAVVSLSFDEEGAEAQLPAPILERRADLSLLRPQTPSVTATMRQALLFEQKVEEMKPSKR